ncbi:GTPase [Thalassoglobus sp.]|uniref:GTPase n=1 Tax=Thalassoglobus sp. TaxID=2795869 RepID=UPI003AA94A40
MKDDDLQQLELLSTLDRLRHRVTTWSSVPLQWEPALRCQSLITRILSRVETLQFRYEAPIVVATFGGTGTGKSSLVNALVGEEVSSSGRERPTTRKPKLIVHFDTDLKLLNLPLDDIDVVQSEADVLRDLVILDCPDPDTNEDSEAGTNLDRLRKLLPYCDVLLVVSTQQKYRSARVSDELLAAASGCRMIFVQTHADLDEDIRADWRSTLVDQYQVPDLFFVDSLKAFHERQQSQHPTGDFGRLIDLLTSKLGASERLRIRRANIVDLLQSGLARCLEMISRKEDDLKTLDAALSQQREQLSQKMAQQLKKELLASHGLWERRLLSAVTDHWGLSPFSACLRFYSGIGGLLASLTFFRARSTAQLALLGTIQGKRWLDHFRSEQRSEETLQRVSQFGLDESHLREAEIVIDGHVSQAGFDSSVMSDQSLDQLRKEAAAVESQFVVDAGQKIDESIEELARKNSKFHVRCWYEFLFVAYLIFVLYRVGANFFYESFILHQPLLSSDFYIPAGLFLILWSGLLVILLTRRLRRGLRGSVETLVNNLVNRNLEKGLFPQLEQSILQTRRWANDARQLQTEVSQLRDEIATSPHFGAKNNDKVP